MSKYLELRKVDVSEHIEKKGRFNYLSWAHAVDILLQQDPNATWQYHTPLEFNDTVMVFCSVTAFGKVMTAQLPVLDYQNKALKNPDAMDKALKNPDAMAVNTAMQRCLAKAIALHGLGLYIYQGEDLPDVSPLDTLKETYADKGIDAARVVYAKMSKEDRDQCAEFVATLKAA